MHGLLQSRAFWCSHQVPCSHADFSNIEKCMKNWNSSSNPWPSKLWNSCLYSRLSCSAIWAGASYPSPLWPVKLTQYCRDWASSPSVCPDFDSPRWHPLPKYVVVAPQSLPSTRGFHSACCSLASTQQPAPTLWAKKRCTWNASSCSSFVWGSSTKWALLLSPISTTPSPITHANAFIEHRW